jgi:hypothetical protein
MARSEDGNRRRTTIVIGAESMRQIEHSAVDAHLPMTRMLEALIELALADETIRQQAVELARSIEDDYRAGRR